MGRTNNRHFRTRHMDLEIRNLYFKKQPERLLFLWRSYRNG
jgi:hypothetical protein